MKIVIKTLLLSCLALTNAVSLCGGDTGFHNYAPSLLYSATQKLSQKQMDDDKINPAIRYVAEINSPRADLFVDEVLSAINHKWITPDEALEIAFDKKRIDIAESIIERMPTQTQEQRKARIDAIKATQITFSNLMEARTDFPFLMKATPESAQKVGIMLEEVPYMEFPSNNLKAPSGLSIDLLREIQETAMPINVKNLAQAFTHNPASYDGTIVLNAVGLYEFRDVVYSHRNDKHKQKALWYDFFNAIKQENPSEIDNYNYVAVSMSENLYQGDPLLTLTLKENLLESLQTEETPSTIEQVRFLLKALPKNYPLEKWLLELAARQNKKAFLALLLEYDNGKIGLFDRCIMRTRAFIPTKYDNLMLRTVQCAALGFMAYKSFRYFQYLEATDQYLKVNPQAISIDLKNTLKWSLNMLLGRIVLGVSGSMIR
jgi:hypothetical protein